VGIEDIVPARVTERAMGFGVKAQKPIDERNWLRRWCRKRILQVRMIPEFMGRVPIVVPFDESLSTTWCISYTRR
jgi:ATP-dependent protease Clp ATPase subunit